MATNEMKPQPSSTGKIDRLAGIPCASGSGGGLRGEAGTDRSVRADGTLAGVGMDGTGGGVETNRPGAGGRERPSFGPLLAELMWGYPFGPDCESPSS